MKDMKNSWREKVDKARDSGGKVCQFCHNMVEMSMAGMSQFTMTYDKVNVSFDASSMINNSFHNTKGSFKKAGANGAERRDTPQGHHFETQGS